MSADDTVQSPVAPCASAWVSLDNRMDADKFRRLLASRVAHWNQMRHTAVDIAGEDEECISAFRRWLIDDVYWYARECVNSMGIGIYVDLVNLRSDRTQVQRINNRLRITIGPSLELLAHTPASYTFKTKNGQDAFFASLVNELVGMLEEDGFVLSGRDSMDRTLAWKDYVHEGMRDMGIVRLTVQWADMRYADLVENIEWDSQLDAIAAGVPVEDVLA